MSKSSVTHTQTGHIESVLFPVYHGYTVLGKVSSEHFVLERCVRTSGMSRLPDAPEEWSQAYVVSSNREATFEQITEEVLTVKCEGTQCASLFCMVLHIRQLVMMYLISLWLLV